MNSASGFETECLGLIPSGTLIYFSNSLLSQLVIAQMDVY